MTIATTARMPSADRRQSFSMDRILSLRRCRVPRVGAAGPRGNQPKVVTGAPIAARRLGGRACQPISGTARSADRQEVKSQTEGGRAGLRGERVGGALRESGPHAISPGILGGKPEARAYGLGVSSWAFEDPAFGENPCVTGL